MDKTFLDLPGELSPFRDVSTMGPSMARLLPAVGQEDREKTPIPQSFVSITGAYSLETQARIMFFSTSLHSLLYFEAFVKRKE